MKNNKFLMDTFTLILGGFLVKILSFFIKILLTRYIGVDGIKIYSLILPFFSLVVTIASFSLPQSIATLINKNKINKRVLLSSGLYLITFINFIFMILIIIFSNYISLIIFHDIKYKILIVGCALSMPNMGIACILKGYFYGIGKSYINVISNFFEQVFRLLFLIIVLPSIVNKSIILGIFYYLVFYIVTESVSIIVFLLFIPNKSIIRLNYITFSYYDINYLFWYSITLVIHRLVGNIGYFLEPFILEYSLIKLGYSFSFYSTFYGIFNGYSVSLLLMPSFFISAISTSLLPLVSKYYNSKNYLLLRKIIKESISISLILGIIFTFCFVIFRDSLLNLFYGNNYGSIYIVYLGIFFYLYYIEGPLYSILEGCGFNKLSFYISLIGIIIKLSSIYIFCNIFKSYIGYIFSEGLSIIVIVFLLSISVYKIIKNE